MTHSLNAPLVDAQGRILSELALARAQRWFRELLDEGACRTRCPRVSLIVQDRFRAAAWLLIGLTNECVINPIDPDLPEELIETQLLKTEPDFIITDLDKTWGPKIHVSAAFVDGLDGDSIPESGAKKPLLAERRIRGHLLLYTSGTTGLAKGVLLGAEQLRANVETAIRAFGYGPGWRTGSILPFFHSFTVVSDLLTMLCSGGTCVVAERCSLGTLQAVLEAFKINRVNSYSAVPLLFQMLARFWPREIDSLKFGISGAAPLTEAVHDQCVAAFGYPVLACYGMTEATCFITITPPGSHRHGSAGMPQGVEVRILGDSGKPAPVGEVGELALRGPSVVRDGYFCGGPHMDDLYRDGFLLTGDIGKVDADGWVFITGRRKNMVIRAGEKVYLEDVDRVVSEIPGVTDCSSIAWTRSGKEDQAVTFVVAPELSNPTVESVVREIVRRKLGGKSVPNVIHSVLSIPRTPTGKPRVAELRKMQQELSKELAVGS